MGSKNGTWLRFLKSTLDPLFKLSKNLQGERGVDINWQSLTPMVYLIQSLARIFAPNHTLPEHSGSRTLPYEIAEQPT